MTPVTATTYRTLNDWLREGSQLLAPVSTEAPLEAELLLRTVLGYDRAELYRHLREPISPHRTARYRSFLERRLGHEPTPYILGRKEFSGLSFDVTAAAIIPRPETESLVELVIAFARGRVAPAQLAIADIGTGSGAIAIALAHALPSAHVIATDVSSEALTLAQRNGRRHGLAGRIRFRHGNLLEPLPAPVDVIAANLPYVTTADWQRLAPEIRDHEPRLGLDGGSDGLRAIARLLHRAPAYLRPGGALFAEIGDDQGRSAARLAREAFPNAKIKVTPDLAGRDRVLAVYV